MKRISLWYVTALFLCSWNSFAIVNSTPPQRIYFNNESYSIQEILSKYIQIESISGNEKKAGDFLKQLCTENGLHITQMGNRDGNYNFSASLHPLEDQKPNIIFLNHIDVVPAGDETNWEHPPFSGEITDTEIWGRGAFDNKGAAIMQLFSIIEMARRYQDIDTKFNVTFLAVSCEETQCSGGIDYVVANYLDLLNPEVVIGEGPPALKGLIENKPNLALFGISVAQKRTLWIELSLEIKTNGHSSVTPEAYANKEMVIALNNLLDKKNDIIYNEVNVGILKELGKLNGGFTGFVLKHPRLFKGLITRKLRRDPLLLSLFSNTITLTSIKDKNEKLNTIPSKVIATLDCRLLPKTTTDDFIKELQEILNNPKIEINILNEMENQEVSSVSTKFYKHLVKAIDTNYPKSKITPVLLPNSNDVGAFRSLKIPCYSVVPVRLSREYLETVHNFNERIPKDILDEGKDTFVSFLDYCLSEENDSKRKEKRKEKRKSNNKLDTIGN